MKKLLFIGMAACIGWMLSSCGSQRILSENNTRLLPVSSTAYTIPTVADLRVSSSKISHQVTVANRFSSKELSEESDSPILLHLQKMAITQAAMKYDADLIVAPSYSISTADDQKTITVTVTGYPANYTNFRPATAADMEIIGKNPETNMVVPCTSTAITEPTWNEKHTR